MAKRLIRKRFVIAFVLTSAIGLFFVSAPLREKMGARLLKIVLQKSLHREVSWREMHIELLPPQLRFKDFAIAPLVRAETVTVAPSLRFLGSAIFISGLTVNLNATPSPDAGSGPMHLPFLYLSHLSVIRSRLLIEDTEVPLDGEFEDLALYTRGDKGFLWARKNTLRIRDYTPITFSLRATFHEESEHLVLERVRLDGPDAFILGKGTLSTSPPELYLEYSLKAGVAPWLERFRLPAEAEGQGALEGNLHYYNNSFTTQARGRISGTKVLGSRAGDLIADVNLNVGTGGRRVNAGLQGRYARVRAGVEIGKQVETRVELFVNQAPVKKILDFFHVPTPNYDRPVDGTGTFTFDDDRIEEARGRVELADPARKLRFSADLEGLGMRNARASLHDGELNMEAEGEFRFNATDPVRMEGTVSRSSLRGIQTFLSPFLPALDPVEGWAEGRFQVTGNFGKTLLQVQAEVSEVRYADLPWGEGPVALHLEGSDFRLDSVRLSLGNGVLDASGTIPEGFAFTYEKWPWTLPLDMALSGTGRMLFSPSFLIQGRVASADIPSLPVPVEQVEARFTYDGTILTLQDVDARAGDGRLTASGRYEKNFQFEGTAEKFPLAEGVTASGILSGEYKGAASRADVRLTLEGTPEAVFPARVNASLEEGRLKVEADTARCGSLAAEGTLSGDLALDLAGRFSGLQIPLPPFKLDPPAEAAFAVRGSLKDMESLSGGAQFPPLSIYYAENEFKVPKGLKLTLEKGRLSIPSTDISHDYAIIEAQGEARLKKYLPFEARVIAYFGDDIVRHLIPELDYSGEATMDLVLSKPARTLDLNGTLDIQGSLLEILPIHMPLERPRGLVRFSGNRIALENFSARTGQGRISAHGEAFTRPGSGLATVNLQVEGTQVEVNYPRGFRMVVDGEAELLITPTGRILTAEAVLVEGTYTKDLNLLSELTRVLRPSAELPSYSNLPDIRLAIDIEVPGTLKVLNQIVDATAQGELQVAGTLPRPVFLGQLETLPGSKIYFNGVTYTVDRAQVQLNNPQTLDPYIDLEAVATVKSYLVHLKITGPLSRLKTQFTSDPYLTENDIISLLATGKIASQEQGVYLSGATLLLSQQLSQQLSKNTSAIFGLDRIRIEPIVGESTISSAKLTVTKQVSPACALSYTYNPSINQKDIIAVECSVTRDSYLTLLQEEDGSYSLQVFRRKKF